MHRHLACIGIMLSGIVTLIALAPAGYAPAFAPASSVLSRPVSTAFFTPVAPQRAADVSMLFNFGKKDAAPKKAAAKKVVKKVVPKKKAVAKKVAPKRIVKPVAKKVAPKPVAKKVVKRVAPKVAAKKPVPKVAPKPVVRKVAPKPVAKKIVKRVPPKVVAKKPVPTVAPKAPYYIPKNTAVRPGESELEYRKRMSNDRTYDNNRLAKKAELASQVKLQSARGPGLTRARSSGGPSFPLPQLGLGAVAITAAVAIFNKANEPPPPPVAAGVSPLLVVGVLGLGAIGALLLSGDDKPAVAAAPTPAPAAAPPPAAEATPEAAPKVVASDAPSSMTVDQACKFMASNPEMPFEEKKAFLVSKGVSAFVIAEAACTATDATLVL